MAKAVFVALLVFPQIGMAASLGKSAVCPVPTVVQLPGPPQLALFMRQSYAGLDLTPVEAPADCGTMVAIATEASEVADGVDDPAKKAYLWRQALVALEKRRSCNDTLAQKIDPEDVQVKVGRACMLYSLQLRNPADQFGWLVRGALEVSPPCERGSEPSCLNPCLSPDPLQAAVLWEKAGNVLSELDSTASHGVHYPRELGRWTPRTMQATCFLNAARCYSKTHHVASYRREAQLQMRVAEIFAATETNGDPVEKAGFVERAAVLFDEAADRYQEASELEADPEVRRNDISASDRARDLAYLHFRKAGQLYEDSSKEADFRCQASMSAPEEREEECTEREHSPAHNARVEEGQLKSLGDTYPYYAHPFRHIDRAPPAIESQRSVWSNLWRAIFGS